MVDGQMGAHRALIFGQIGLKGGLRGLLHQGSHPRGGEYGQGTGAGGDGGIIVGDQAFGPALGSDRNRHE